MSTDFFQRQTKARKNTMWLIVMFFIALIGIVLASFFAFAFVGRELIDDPAQAKLSILSRESSSAQLGAAAGGISAVLIVFGTLYKVLSLRRGGGIGVAESIGGRPAHTNASTLAERRLLNIVEEMAIASGTPVPPVFVLDEPGINAFAAGYSSDDAVIGVSRGALDQLSREELQGVIAHEFSHILNGDMRMNIRMIGILHGILLIALIGKMVFHSVGFTGGHRSRSNRDKGSGVLVLLAVSILLLVIGSVGSLIGGLIKAAVSRQREYLADASAVQFTRNPGGIAGALKKIGGISSHGMLKHGNAAVASHMYFSKGVFELTSLMATHPPLAKRILAIEPAWNGAFPKVDKSSASAITNQLTAEFTPNIASGFSGGASGHELSEQDSHEQDSHKEASFAAVSQAADQIGAPQDYHRRYAAALIGDLDPVLLEAIREPYSVRAVVFALLLDRDMSIRQSQLQDLSKLVGPKLADLTRDLVTRTDALPDEAYLPVVDMALPALTAMSPPQFNAFMQSFNKLARADSTTSLFEWTLAQVLRRHLRSRFEPVRNPMTLYYRLQRLSHEVSLLLSTLARVGHHDAEIIEHAFSVGAKHMSIPIDLLPGEACTLAKLDAALKRLVRSSVQCRGRLVDACAAVVCADGEVRVREAELLRGIADLLHCPVPPLIERPPTRPA